MDYNKKNNSLFIGRITFILMMTVFLTSGFAIPSFAGTGDVLLGVASSQDETGMPTGMDQNMVNAENFSEYFTNSGTTDPSLTIGGNVEAQIGAIWTGGSEEEWRQIRIVIDSNGDGELTPFDWSSPSNPWNRPDNGTPNDYEDDPTTWDYTFPEDYPETSMRGETITMTWNEDCWCVDGFPWDTFQWWWYESDYDKTDAWWMESGQLMNIWWQGRDQEWNMLPNGNYKIQVWVDENDDMEFGNDEANMTMIIAIETASITGTVIDSQSAPIEGAMVEASSHMAWGQTRTGADGTFTISGLQAGANYWIRVMADGKVTGETDVELPAETSTASVGTIQLGDAIAITGTIKLDKDADGILDEVEDQFAAFTNQWGWEQMDLWIWVDAWNMQGPGWGNANVVFNVGDSSATFSINIPPPDGTVTYHVNVNAEGFATDPIEVSVDSSGGTVGDIILTKASILTGTVKLPATTDQWAGIDVQAISTTDNDVRYWGWGNIDPWMSETQSTDTGEFRIDGIPAGTYNIEVRVWGFMTSVVENVVVEQGIDEVIDEIAVSLGNTISGTLTILGDTTELQRWHGDSAEMPLDIWIDAWSHAAVGVALIFRLPVV